MLPYGCVPFHRHSLIIQENFLFVNTFLKFFCEFFWQKQIKTKHAHLPYAILRLDRRKEERIVDDLYRPDCIIANVIRLVKGVNQKILFKIKIFSLFFRIKTLDIEKVIRRTTINSTYEMSYLFSCKMYNSVEKTVTVEILVWRLFWKSRKAFETVRFDKKEYGKFFLRLTYAKKRSCSSWSAAICREKSKKRKKRILGMAFFRKWCVMTRKLTSRPFLETFDIFVGELSK